MLPRVSQLLQHLFPLWILASAWLGYTFPKAFASGQERIPLALGVVMLGMGVTISIQEWTGLRYATRWLGVGLLAQYLVMPILALILSLTFHLPQDLIVGMILVGAAPGGTASNVITFLARADLPLSLAMTTISTLVSPILTPFWVTILAGHWIPIDPIPLFRSVVEIILFPVLLGTGIRWFFTPPRWVNEHLLPLLSMGVIAWIVGVIIALNRDKLSGTPLLYIAVLFHHSTGLALGYAFARFFRAPKKQARTIAIEVGIQNSGLSVALATRHFNPIAALPGALFSVIQNLVGPLVALYFRHRPVPEEGQDPGGLPTPSP